MIKYFTFIVLILFVLDAKGERAITVKPDFKSVSFKDNFDYLVDSTETLGLRQVIASKSWNTFAGNNPNFGENPYPHWVRFSVRNNTDAIQKLTLVTKGLDSLQAYLTQGDSVVKKFALNGSHIPLSLREHPSPYLTLTFETSPDKEYTLWIRMRNLNYRLTASPFVLYKESEAKQFLQRKTFFQSFYIGGMGIILLFSVVLVALFRDALYAYYLGCVLCSLSIMLIYNDYTFLLFDKLPNIVLNKDIYGIITAMVPSLYILFAEKYLRIAPFRQTPLVLFSKGIVLLQIFMLVLFVATGNSLFHMRNFFYLPMLALSVLSFVYVYKSLREGYVPAWLFLLGTAPVSIVVMLETASDLHSIPVQEIHENYYYATLFEMFALTCGLAYRFKLNFDERRILQKEILLTHINAQERERISIAADLHDIIGSQLSAVRLNLEYLQVQYFADSNKSWWAPVYKILNILSENISTIADQMRNASLAKLGLPAILEQMYGHLKKPVFKFDFTGFQKRIPEELERVLYVVINEALNNCIKHAEATQINVQLIKENSLITVIIEDNGIGFDTGHTTKGQGLRNMEIRVKEFLQGEFLIDSQPGSGTVMIIKVALKEEI